MNGHKKSLDFTGANIYIGIDVHLRQWTVTLRSAIFELRTFSMNPSPKELIEHLQLHYPNAKFYSAYEAGFCGFWIHRKLTQLGIHNMVVNPADVPTTHKDKTQKRDKRDSRKLAKALSDNSLTPIYIPTPEQETLRLLSRLVCQVSKRTKQIKNRIKQFCHTQGIEIPKRSEMSHWSRRFINWLKSIEFEYHYAHYYLDKLLNDLEHARRQKLDLLKNIRSVIKDILTIKYLRSVPGIGLITAFAFYTEVMDIHRFKMFDKLISFIGIIPSVESSDEKEKILGLTNRCNKYLRYLLIEAAWVAARKDPALTIAFDNQLKDKCSQKAIIRIVKKLINRMRYVWINQQDYVVAVAE